MSQPVSDLNTLLASMAPELNRRRAAFVSFPGHAGAPELAQEDIIGSFREKEGLTLIVDLDAAERAGIPVMFRAAWITLTVHSDLEAVGLTAAFAAALGEAGISCNVVAAAFHDHIFVPEDKAEAALSALRALQKAAADAHEV